MTVLDKGQVHHDVFTSSEILDDPEFDIDICLNWKVKRPEKLAEHRLSEKELPMELRDKIRNFISDQRQANKTLSTKDMEILLQLWYDQNFHRIKEDYGVKLLQVYLDRDQYRVSA